MLDGTLGFTLDAPAPPLVHGVARLAGILYAGGSFGDLLDLIGPAPAAIPGRAAWLMDRAWAYWLNFSPYQAQALQDEALALQRVFRVRGTAGLRLLALSAPGGLMVNAPLDFIAAPAGLQLDIAFTFADGRPPAALPDHDVAMVAASESAPDALAGMARLFGAWPRPILNDPARILPMSRTWLPRCLAGLPGLSTPPAIQACRAALAGDAPALLPGGGYPLLVRPLGSHAGHGLRLLAGPDDMARFLAEAEGDEFTLTRFVDYRSPDGWFRKYRIAFVAGRPFLCHMAASGHWMVHYLNAGMDADPAKRAAEAEAMAGFASFCGRHAAALAGLAQAIGLDYFSIDCAEAAGQLLVFEADTAAIIHSMDDPGLYPYKAPVMQRCYDAFGAMLRQAAGVPVKPPPPAPPPAPSSAPAPASA